MYSSMVYTSLRMHTGTGAMDLPFAKFDELGTGEHAPSPIAVCTILVSTVVIERDNDIV